MTGIRVAPSVLAADLGDLRGAVEIANEGGADLVHLDVIDGHFAPNITFGPGTVKSLRRFSDLPFDVHLMITEPLRYVDRFIDAGADIMTFHAEVLDGSIFDELSSRIHAKGRSIGIALKPSTELPAWARERMDKLETIIVMTVNPGFSGQSMDRSVLPKMAAIAEQVARAGSVSIEVDGGVELENVRDVVSNGARILVAGAAVYARPDPKLAITQIKQAAEAGGV